MIAAGALLLYAAAAGFIAPHWLRRRSLADRSPALGILLWQCLGLSGIGAVVLAGSVLALPEIEFTPDLARLIRACTTALQAQYSTPAGAATGGVGIVLALGVVVRASACTAREMVRARRARIVQMHALHIVAGFQPGIGARVLPHGVATVYCLPGRRGGVVLTTAALAALDGEELVAVLAHERAHLAYRHHRILTVAAGLRRAFPHVPLFDLAHGEQARLVEMHADDVAARRSGRVAVATALVRLAESTAPAAALSAGGDTTLSRVRRLATPHRPLGATRALGATLGALLLLTGPAMIAAAPAVAAADVELCPVPPQ